MLNPSSSMEFLGVKMSLHAPALPADKRRYIHRLFDPFVAAHNPAAFGNLGRLLPETAKVSI